MATMFNFRDEWAQYCGDITDAHKAVFRGLADKLDALDTAKGTNYAAAVVTLMVARSDIDALAQKKETGKALLLTFKASQFFHELVESQCKGHTDKELIADTEALYTLEGVKADLMAASIVN